MINTQLILKELKGVKSLLFDGLIIAFLCLIFGILMGPGSVAFRIAYSIFPFIFMLLNLAVGINIVAGEKDQNTSDFLMSKPMGRIRVFLNKVISFALIVLVSGFVVMITILLINKAGLNTFDSTLCFRSNNIAVFWKLLLLVFATAVFFGTFSKDIFSSLLAAIFGDGLIILNELLKHKIYRWDYLNTMHAIFVSVVLLLGALYFFGNKKAPKLKYSLLTAIIIFFLLNFLMYMFY